MQTTTNSCIQNRLLEAVDTFREKAHDSKVANEIISLLLRINSDKQYATGGRNECVSRLAEDVESRLDMKANLMFRAPGALHDALQALMDVYEDATDGICYYVE